MRIVSFYAALFALFFVLLTLRVSGARRRAGIAIGTGDSEVLLRAVRAHANFAEFVPLALLLVALAEAQGAAGWFVHAACLVLGVGRIAHAAGVARVDEDFRYRVVGTACTLLVLTVVALELLAMSLRA